MTDAIIREKEITLLNLLCPASKRVVGLMSREKNCCCVVFPNKMQGNRQFLAFGTRI